MHVIYRIYGQRSRENCIKVAFKHGSGKHETFSFFFVCDVVEISAESLLYVNCNYHSMCVSLHCFASETMVNIIRLPNYYIVNGIVNHINAYKLLFYALIL